MKLTIAGGMAMVVVAGLAFASLRAASPLWASSCLTASLALMTITTVAAICSSGRRRPFWAGFVIGGWLYIILSLGPFLDESLGARLVTTALLDLAYEHVARPVDVTATAPTHPTEGRGTDFAAQDAEAKARMRQYESLGLGRDFYGWGGRTILHSSTEFRRIGHAWLAPMVACLVGFAALKFHDTRPEGEDRP